MPSQRTVIRSRGPYHVSDETALMREHRIEVLVTKNSGGEMTRAKLVAARDLGIEVVMVDRPREQPGVLSVDDVAAAADQVRRLIGGAQPL